MCVFGGRLCGGIVSPESCVCLHWGGGVFAGLGSCTWGGLVSGREDATVGRVHEGECYIWRI